MRLIALLVTLFVCSGACAQWPSKPVRILVGYAPGGTADVSARVAGEAVGRALNQSIVVENRPGASGGIAFEAVAKAPPDGYTLLVAPDSSLFLSLVKPSFQYSVEKHLAPITVLTNQPMVIVTHPSTGVSSLAELVALIKASPVELPYATATAAGTQNIAAEVIFRMAGVKLQNIPYKGGGQAVQDLLSGQVKIAMLGAAPVIPHGQSGKLRLVAITPKTRSSSMPGVPTIAESGYPGYDMTQWFGVLAPIGTPDEVQARLAAEFRRALTEPAVVQRLASSGLEPGGDAPAEFARRIKMESVTWARAAREFGIRGE